MVREAIKNPTFFDEELRDACAKDGGDLKTALIALLICQDYMQHHKEKFPDCTLRVFYRQRVFNTREWAVCGAVSNTSDIQNVMGLDEKQKVYLKRIVDQEIVMTRTRGAMNRMPEATSTWV